MPERPSRAISQPDADQDDGGRSLPAQPAAAAEPEPEGASRLRSFIVAEALAVLLGYVVSTLREGAPATPAGPGTPTTEEDETAWQNARRS